MQAVIDSLISITQDEGNGCLRISTIGNFCCKTRTICHEIRISQHALLMKDMLHQSLQNPNLAIDVLKTCIEINYYNKNDPANDFLHSVDISDFINKCNEFFFNNVTEFMQQDDFINFIINENNVRIDLLAEFNDKIGYIPFLQTIPTLRAIDLLKVAREANIVPIKYQIEEKISSTFCDDCEAIAKVKSDLGMEVALEMSFRVPNGFNKLKSTYKTSELMESAAKNSPELFNYVMQNISDYFSGSSDIKDAVFESFYKMDYKCLDETIVLLFRNMPSIKELEMRFAK